MLASASTMPFTTSRFVVTSTSRGRRPFSCSRTRRGETSSSTSASRRSARFTARPGADMVGPPDPLSNLRPVRYGSAFEQVSSSSSPASSSSIHPYSLNEFTASASGSTSMSRSNKGRSHSEYFERLLARLEEAELAQKLRLARADNFNQRFWEDNNARFIQALSGFRSHTGSSKAVATLRSPASSGHVDSAQPQSEKAVVNTNQQESELDLDSDSLATFYSAWLKANAARHRAYNRQLWAQTFGDLAPAARYQRLRAWAKFVGSVERRLGRS